MTYDFDKVINRRGTDSEKWDILAPNELPMWVADMDFEVAQPIRDAIQKRLDQGVYGYSFIPDRWAESYINWWRNRHQYTMEADWLIFSTGVIPSMSSIVRKLTTPAEKVVFLTPVYNIFYNSVLNNGRVVSECQLIPQEDGTYAINWEDLEKRMADPQASMMFLCNPHNPTGRIWTREELERIGQLAEKYSVIVVSDEIHCDLTDPGTNYVPFGSVSETCRRVSVTCIAPTKCFNIAGLHTSAICVPDPVLRHRVNRGLNTDECAEPNVFAIDAAVAAFNEGGEWLDQMRAYVAENKALVRNFVAREIPELRVCSGPATYLLWMDGRSLRNVGHGAKMQQGMVAGAAVGGNAVGAADASAGGNLAAGESDASGNLLVAGESDAQEQDHNYGSKAPLADYIREKTGLFLSNGEQYGKGGAFHLRMNLACPRSIVEDGLKRLKAGVEAWVAE